MTEQKLDERITELIEAKTLLHFAEHPDRNTEGTFSGGALMAAYEEGSRIWALKCQELLGQLHIIGSSTEVNSVEEIKAYSEKAIEEFWKGVE